MNRNIVIPKISILIPCFNEEEVLIYSTPILIDFLKKMIHDGIISKDSNIIFVDDGSIDKTWNIIERNINDNPDIITAIKLSRNFGHQSALICALDYATNKCDAAISIDVDLQDDLNVIPKMIEHFNNNYEIVLGVRESRNSDSWFKKSSANIFYKFIKLMGVNVIENHADYRLMSNKCLLNLQKFNEYNLFLRGFPNLLHNKITTVYYARAKRHAGQTKYPLKKMFSLAWDGITSFSIIPLRIISLIGIFVFFTSIIMMTYVLFSVFQHKNIPGWASIVLPMYLLGGMIMLSLGIVGEYIGKVFLEVKSRPRFLIDQVLNGKIN